ncbi:hypothetical protein [Nonomuraea ceibae]|nr:hypothetical protein [Nonomuraea ceibae]
MSVGSSRRRLSATAAAVATIANPLNALSAVISSGGVHDPSR